MNRGNWSKSKTVPPSNKSSERNLKKTHTYWHLSFEVGEYQGQREDRDKNIRWQRKEVELQWQLTSSHQQQRMPDQCFKDLIWKWISITRHTINQVWENKCIPRHSRTEKAYPKCFPLHKDEHVIPENWVIKESKEEEK